VLGKDTSLSGGARDWNKPDAKNHVPVLRKRLLEKKAHQAAGTECRKMQGPCNHAYRRVGDLRIDFADAAEASGRRLCTAPRIALPDNVDIPAVRHHDAPMPLLVNHCAVLLSVAAGSGNSRTALAQAQKLPP